MRIKNTNGKLAPACFSQLRQNGGGTIPEHLKEKKHNKSDLFSCGLCGLGSKDESTTYVRESNISLRGKFRKVQWQNLPPVARLRTAGIKQACIMHA